MTDFRLKVAVAPRQAPVTTSPLDIGTYPTNIEGPGSAWAFVLSGTVFAARLTRSNFNRRKCSVFEGCRHVSQKLCTSALRLHSSSVGVNRRPTRAPGALVE